MASPSTRSALQQTATFKHLLQAASARRQPDLVHHEHFGLAPSAWEQIGRPISCSEFTDLFFDTTDFRLRAKNCWLRCRQNIFGRTEEWTLKTQFRRGSKIVYQEHTGTANIMAELASLIGGGAHMSPLGYCQRLFAAIRTRRYLFPQMDGFEWWIDVCSFGLSENYVVGTLKSLPTRQDCSSVPCTADFGVITPVQSRISAYLSSGRPAAVQGQGCMFLAKDPLGGGEFSSFDEDASEASDVSGISDNEEDASPAPTFADSFPT